MNTTTRLKFIDESIKPLFKYQQCTIGQAFHMQKPAVLVKDKHLSFPIFPNTVVDLKL